MAKIALPPFALEFVDAQPSSRFAVRGFHRWLKASHRPLLQLTQDEIDVFLRSLTARDTPAQRLVRNRLIRYFDWLFDRGLLRFDPRCAWPRANFPLPPLAELFVQSLEPVLRKSTINAYRTSLRQFHIWLHARGLDASRLDRDATVQWTRWLHERGLHAATRRSSIQHIRSYLRWLEDRAALPVPADSLIRGCDLPKLPKYLPRPLPPDLDRSLQNRLARSEDVLKLGLLLMRRTGLRIGELIALPYSCLHTDPKGNRLLKVPLGKLNSERLVPLDKRALKVLRKLRRLGARRRTHLIEHKPGQPPRYWRYARALRSACRGLLDDGQRVVSHQLRHTYATSLLAGGMSLVGVMRLLGHKDYRMTLRYAAITDETVLIEYAAALDKSAQRYQITTTTSAPLHLDPARQLTDLARNLLMTATERKLDPRKTRALAVRLRRLAAEIRKLT